MLSSNATVAQSCRLTLRLSRIHDMLGPDSTDLTDAIVEEAGSAFRRAVELPAKSIEERLAKVQMLECELHCDDRLHMPGMLADIAV